MNRLIPDIMKCIGNKRHFSNLLDPPTSLMDHVEHLSRTFRQLHEHFRHQPTILEMCFHFWTEVWRKRIWISGVDAAPNTKPTCRCRQAHQIHWYCLEIPMNTKQKLIMNSGFGIYATSRRTSWQASVRRTMSMVNTSNSCLPPNQTAHSFKELVSVKLRVDVPSNLPFCVRGKAAPWVPWCHCLKSCRCIAVNFTPAACQG